MGRRNLYGTGSKLRLHIIVGNDRYLTVRQRQRNRFAYQVFIAIIVGIYGNGCITEHRFGAGSRNNDIGRTACVSGWHSA